ncbi:endonuclease domain-containing protein [Fodinicola acaciae]|uniref:endonuclease domain-containing protein n=1 Tax=Fodinicola acaciae TaxID=2681555 RepID=UPI0013D253E3|nr:DUF559 domain-containing protein [Fodinicola acaciae]
MFDPITRSCALARGETDNKLRGRQWARQHRGVYVRFGIVDDATPYKAALAAAGHDATLSHFSAAARWRLPLPIGCDGRRPVHVTVRPPRPRHRKGVRVHENLLAACDIAELDGIPVTSVGRTWFDLAATCHFYDHVAITDAILHRGLSTRERLTAAIRAGHRGAKAARRSLEAADERAESPWETRTRLVLHAADLMVVPQVSIADDFDVIIARTDLALVEHKIAIEYDGGHHLDRDQARADLDRVRTMERHGWLVLRFGADDLLHRERQVIAEVKTAIRRRRKG